MSVNNWIAKRFNKVAQSTDVTSPRVISKSTKEIIAEEVALRKAVKEADWGILTGDHRDDAGTLDHTYHSVNSDISPKYDKAMFSGFKSLSKEKNTDGISKKLVHKIGDDTFMTKAYSANRTTQTSRTGDLPLAGWATMTNKNLYHAAGLQKICEEVGTKLSKTKGSKEEIPTTVHKFARNYTPVKSFSPIVNKTNLHDRLQARQIGIMDFITGNEDRHGGNLMISDSPRDDGKHDLLAIDHDNSFLYNDISLYRSYNNSAMSRYLHDSIIQKKEADSLSGWWIKNKGAILDEMNNNLNSIKDGATRNHIRENFNNRHEHISVWADKHSKQEDTNGVFFPNEKDLESHDFGKVGKHQLKAIKDSLPENKEAALEMLMDQSKKPPVDGGHREHFFAIKKVAGELLDEMSTPDVIKFFGRNQHDSHIDSVKKGIVDIMTGDFNKHGTKLTALFEANAALPKESKFLNEFQAGVINRHIERKKQEKIDTSIAYKEIKEAI